MICAALCFDCPPWEPQLGGFLFGEKTKEVVAPVHFDWTLDDSRSKSTAYCCCRNTTVVSGWLNGWLIGWLYVVVGWYVAGKKNIVYIYVLHMSLLYVSL